ncbi:MAG: 6-carboxytetrahydropterin synthase [Deltaproteobacteria bacterium]|nr:6-carboxytetrahydropterin synthase [Deltaproteobacteria bacterium]
MYRVTKEIHFCYGHRLMNYNGPCMHPHGHNAKVDIDLESETLDKRHILYEFGDLKEIVKDWIDRELDHKMLLHKNDPLVPALQKLDEPVYLFDTNPTAEAIARLIYDYAKSKGLPVREIRVWETHSSYAAYREKA